MEKDFCRNIKKTDLTDKKKSVVLSKIASEKKEEQVKKENK